MKKNSLLLLLLILLIPCFVKADMGMPELKEYEVIVTKKDGIDLIDYNDEVITTIPYETELVISYETFKDGILYGETNYKNKYGYINLDNVAIKDEKFNLEDYKWYYESGEITVIKTGAKLYKGPAFKYGYVDKDMEIEKDTILKYKYRDEQWAYVSYEGKTGWIFVNNNYISDSQEIYTATKLNNNKTIYTVKDINLYSDPRLTEKLDKVIPAFTELEYNVFTSIQPKEPIVFVDFDGTKGWLSIGESYPENDAKFSLENYPKLNALDSINMEYKLISSKEIPIYKDMNLTEKIGSIKQNDDFVEIYYFIGENTPTYVNVKGVKGWVALDHDNNQIAKKDESEIIAIEEIAVYSTPSRSKASIGTIKPNEEVKVKYSIYDNSDNYLYIESPTIKGWALVKFGEYSNAYTYIIELTNDVNIYSKPDQNSEKSKEILKKGTELDIKYTTYNYGVLWYYVDYNGIQGWIDQSMVAEVEPEIEDPEPEEKPQIIKDKNKEDKKEEKMSKTQIALLGIGVAVVISITAIVSIVTIKKKKSKKITEIIENKEDNKEIKEPTTEKDEEDN